MQLREQENTLEERFPKSLHCFYVLLRTTVPYHLILTAYLWGFGWIHNATDLISHFFGRMVSTLVLMGRRRTQTWWGDLCGLRKNEPQEDSSDTTSAGTISSADSDFKWASRALLMIHWCRVKKRMTPPFADSSGWRRMKWWSRLSPTHSFYFSLLDLFTTQICWKEAH